MMGLNALRYPGYHDQVRQLGLTVTDDDVVWLLRSHWRPRVMGAWFAAGRADRVEAELLESLATSLGTLTAPPLAAVAVHGLGERAVPALHTYLEADLANQYGAAGFIAAVLEVVAEAPDGVEITEWKRTAVRGMLDLAGWLAQGPTAEPA